MHRRMNRRVRRTVLLAVAISSVVIFHQSGLGLLTSVVLMMVTVVGAGTLGVTVVDHREGLPIRPGWGNRPHPLAADGLDAVSLKAIIDMSIAAKAKRPASYAMARRVLDRTYVYHGVVVFYALVMLQRTVTDVGAGKDREQLIEQLTDQLLPRWYRLLGRGRDELNYILRRHGTVPPLTENTGMLVDADAAVVALALLLENPIFQIRAMRPHLAAQWEANPTLAVKLRPPSAWS